MSIAELAQSVEISRSDPVPAPSSHGISSPSLSSTAGMSGNNVSPGYYYCAPENVDIMGSIVLIPPTAPPPQYPSRMHHTHLVDAALSPMVVSPGEVGLNTSRKASEEVVNKHMNKALETPFFANASSSSAPPPPPPSSSSASFGGPKPSMYPSAVDVVSRPSASYGSAPISESSSDGECDQPTHVVVPSEGGSSSESSPSPRPMPVSFAAPVAVGSAAPLLDWSQLTSSDSATPAHAQRPSLSTEQERGQDILSQIGFTEPERENSESTSLSASPPAKPDSTYVSSLSFNSHDAPYASDYR
jgi:hypothetical protein